MNGVSAARIAVTVVAICVVLPLMILGIRRLIRLTDQLQHAQSASRWIWSHRTAGSLIFTGVLVLVAFPLALLTVSLTTAGVLSIAFWIISAAWLRWQWDAIVAHQGEPRGRSGTDDP
jgi:hypothetical protein